MAKIVRIEMEDGGVMRAELYPEIAPITVANFEKLVKDGFYDGVIFHRVIPGFMIQGGDPTGTGMGGPGWNIKGEFAANGVPNSLKHTAGVLSMARAMDPNSGGSQFFIMVDDAPHLDGQYAAFGCLIEGLDVARQIDLEVELLGMRGQRKAVHLLESRLFAHRGGVVHHCGDSLCLHLCHQGFAVECAVARRNTEADGVLRPAAGEACGYGGRGNLNLFL